MELIKKDGLKAPKEYWELTEEQKNEMLNQCGGDPITTKIVPNYILGQNVSEACNSHDFMYITGKTANDKRIADQVFEENLKSLTKKNNNGLKGILNHFIVKIYSNLASFFGHFYF